MEEQFRKNKSKQSASDKMDSEEMLENINSKEDSDSSEIKDMASAEDASDIRSSVSEAGVVVQTPGTSGTVQRF